MIPPPAPLSNDDSATESDIEPQDARKQLRIRSGTWFYPLRILWGPCGWPCFGLWPGTDRRFSEQDSGGVRQRSSAHLPRSRRHSVWSVGRRLASPQGQNHPCCVRQFGRTHRRAGRNRLGLGATL